MNAADLGPCSTCSTTIIRYGDHGRTLCPTCQTRIDRLREESRNANHR